MGLAKDGGKCATRNHEAFQRAEAHRIIVPCLGCYKTLAQDYPKLLKTFNVEVFHASQLLVECLGSGKKLSTEGKRVKVTYHDPCQLGRGCGVYEEPRVVINSIKNIEFTEMLANIRENANCCGAGGGVRSAFRAKSLSIAKRRIQEA